MNNIETKSSEEMRPLKDGESIEVGDIIETRCCEQLMWAKRVHRVTKIYAFVQYNDVAEGKFPRIFNGYYYHSVPLWKWDSRSYKVFRKEHLP